MPSLRLIRSLALLASAVLVLPLAAAAQQFVQRRLDPATSVLLSELGAIAEERDGAVTLTTVFPATSRADAYRNLDVQEGDVLLMAAGETLRNIGHLREMYEGVAVGGEVKLAVRRAEDRFLLSFAKADPETLTTGGGGHRRMVMVRGGGDVEVVEELGIVVRRGDGKLTIAAAVAPGTPLAEGDVLESLAGTAIATVAELRTALGKLAPGADVEVGIVRGGEARTVQLELAGSEDPAL